MNDKTSSTPYIDTIVEKFTKASKEFYPGLEFASRYSFYSGVEPTKAKFEFRFHNKILKSTPYIIPPNSLLIHYVPNIEVLINIIKSGTIRLTTLNSKNDRHEISYLSRQLKLDLTEEEVENYKKDFFCASFCKIKNRQDEDFSMWRLYGSEGRGAALVFEIENYSDEWHHFAMGKVQYGINRASEHYGAYMNFVAEFQKVNNYPFQNRPITSMALLALHKNVGWKYENEIRLISNYRYDKYTLDEDADSSLIPNVFHSYKNGCGQYAYMELPLLGSKKYKEHEDRFSTGDLKDHYDTFRRMLPRLKLVNIIIGYQYSEDVPDIESVIAKQAGIHPNYSFNINRSKFSDH
jgi:hypothetical protein